MPVGEEAIDVFAIDRGALALAIGPVRAAFIGAFVPIDAEPTQRVQNRTFALGRASRAVGIFDAKEKIATVPLGKSVIYQRDVSRANMRVASRRRRDTRSYLHVFLFSSSESNETEIGRLADQSAALTASAVDEIDDLLQRCTGSENRLHAAFP